MSRNVGRSRGVEAGLCSVCHLFSVHLLSVICAGCHRAVLFSRQCSQTSAGVWHRARSQQCPEAGEGGPLAREASDVWESCGFSSLHSYLVGLLQVRFHAGL